MNNNNQYTSISSLGNRGFSAINNPITYCINDTIDPYFLHGDTYLNHGGQNSGQCQLFLSDYCAQGWDQYCELASKNINTRYSNIMDNFGNSNYSYGLTSGEVLIRNTAIRKYLIKMIAGKKIFQPFDPTVADSPMISSWKWDDFNYPNKLMKPVFSVDPTTIDNDIVMDKILMKPSIAKDILLNIYQTMKSNDNLFELNNTKLGRFFKVNSHIFN
jgi:hypothetical protein